MGITPQRNRAVAACWSALFGATAIAGIVVAPAAEAAAYTNVLTNPSFAQPGVDGDAPTGWTEKYFDNEILPFNSSIEEYDAAGQFPPPTPIPGGNAFADEIFYEAGSFQGPGTEGDGANQPVSGVTQDDDPQIGYSTVETGYPDPSVADWAGSVYEVDLTSGPQAYQLRYFNPWTPGTQAYASTPGSGATTKYIIGPSISPDTWFTQAPRDLNADVLARFGLGTYTVTGVHFGDLELTTSANSPYPNMDSYFTGLDLGSDQVVGPVPQTPESPLVIALPLSALAAAGGAFWLNRRRRGLAD